MLRYFSRLAVVLAIVGLTGACGSIAAVEGASTVVSDKTVSDHIVSLASGKDCSTVRIEQGLTYCVEDMPKVNQERLYCYRTLADVVCYNRADERATDDVRVGLYEHNLAH